MSATNIVDHCFIHKLMVRKNASIIFLDNGLPCECNHLVNLSLGFLKLELLGNISKDRTYMLWSLLCICVRCLDSTVFFRMHMVIISYVDFGVVLGLL